MNRNTNLALPGAAISRRGFLTGSMAVAGAGLALRFRPSAWAAPLGANSAVRVAVIGLHNKGGAHLKQLLELPGVRVAALCDVDPAILERAGNELKGRQLQPFLALDPRQVFERADVDAVVIATPNHWHALLTWWACQAGKDVYVEKPMSHTVWEGRKMIEAARKYGRIVQVGTQHRSNAGLQEAARYIRDGHCGKIRYIHAVVHFLRKDIGRRLPWYPDKLNYDQYCGPAPMAPLERTQLHYDFHWYWGTGNGDLGNNGVHALDTAFIFAGHQSFPRRIRSLGGRYVIADGAETPNTMLTLYDYAEVPFVFEHRALPAKPGVNFTDNAHGVRTGVVVRCENGYFAGLVGGVVYDNAGKVVKKFPGDGGAKHMPNFLDAVRSRRDRDLVTPVELGHVGASLCHYGNISYRIGGIASRADARIAVAAIPPAEQHFEHLLEHLAIHGVDLERQPLTLGPWLEIDGDNITRVEAGTDATLEYARFLLRETHRPPYTLPEQI